MSKLALYRKYRSADLSNIVGQEHITKTLEASLKNGQISHAYLFSGPRGVGKTSLARILARRVNDIDKDKDINNYLDIVEIDAASNRGIDDVRSLREKLNSSPTQLKYKVIIIDEVHMLTREAFNALLKTLEEPPSHVVFVLATTESHKLPDTIISRTQHYQFRPFTEEQIVGHLKQICNSENIKAQKEGLQAIASLANGGMRDAIGMLDQLAVLGEDLDEDTVQRLIGLSSSSQLNVIYNNLLSGDKKKALESVSNLTVEGIEPNMLCLQLQRYFRNKLIEINNPSDEKKHVLSLEMLLEASERNKYSPNKTLPLEIAIIKIANIFSANNSHIEKEHSAPENDNVSIFEAPTIEPQDSANNSESNIATKDDPNKLAKGLSLIKERNNSLYALLRSGNATLKGDKLVVECRFNFHKQRIEEPRNRETIEKIMSKVCQKPIILKCNLSSKPDKKVDTEKEVISSAMAILGGELVDG